MLGWVPPVVQWWKEAGRSGDPRRVPGTADVCCDGGGTNHAEDEEGSAMVGRHTERAWVCLGWFRPVNRVGACRNLRQGSGVHTHRQVVAGPVCRGIVMCAAINTMLRQPALLLQFGGPSLRRAVTVPICLMPNPVAPALQQQACFPGLLAAFRCQPCTR